MKKTNNIKNVYQFALCEASKYFFYLRYESGPLYKPSTRNFELVFKEISEADAARLMSIWRYWEDEEVEPCVVDEGLHPDHVVV